MGMGGGSSRDKLQSDINVTPLVDVCLVLLIIFMVVTPMLQKGIDVQLPDTDNPDKKPENASQKLITVKWATPPTATTSRPKALSKRGLPDAARRALPALAHARSIIIKADQRLKYGDVKDVMKMTKDAGFQNVGLITDKKQSAPRRGALGRQRGDASMAMAAGGEQRLQERHQRHAARRRRARAPHHLHGHHARCSRWATTSRSPPRRRWTIPRSPSGPAHRVADRRRTGSS